MAQKFTVPITVKQLSSAGSDAITVYVDADTYARLKIEAGGRLTWGTGSGVGDVNLYRDSADVLRTDDTFKTPSLYVDNIEIDPTGATTDQVLKFNGVKFVSASVAAGGGGASLTVSDTAPTSPTEGDLWFNSSNAKTYVYYDSTWVEIGASGGVATLDEIGDVSASAPSIGDLIQWNGSVWANVSSSAVGATNLDGLTDVTITSAVDGQILVYDGTNWVNTVRPSNEPMGFENAASSAISFDKTNRQFSISPVSGSFTVWVNGKRFVKTGTETITIADTSALYYIYYNSSGTLSSKTTFFTLSSEAPIAYVYWNQSDATHHFFADERHGITLDWATHEYLHRTRGAAIANGFGVNNYTTSGNGSLDAHAQLDIANGTFFDEDLKIDITHSATPASNSHEQFLQGGAKLPVFYRTNTHYRRDTATSFPMKQGTARVKYNLLSGGLWSTPDIDNNKYGITYIVATNDLNAPIFAMMGQAQYTDQGSAEAASWNDMDVSDFPVAEFRILYKIIYQTANAYSNTPHAKLTGIQDLRVSFISGGNLATAPVSDHGTLTGLSDDDHTQYLTDTRHNDLDHSTAMGTVVLDDISDVTAPSPSSGDFLKWNGTAWVNDPINLGTDTVGNYVSDVTAGTGVTIVHTPGEGSSPTVSIGQAVGTSSSVTFAAVTAPLIGNASTATTLQNARIISLSGDLSGSASFNGSTDVTISATVQPNSVALGTDTTGNYMSDVVAGTGLTVSHTPGEGSSASVSLNANLDDLLDVDTTGASVGYVLSYNGSSWVTASAAAGGGASVTVAETPPASPTTGDLWFESDTSRTYVYYDSFWIEIGGVAPGATVSDTAPSNPVTGQVWFNSLNGGTYVYYSSAWAEVGAVPVNNLLNLLDAKGDLFVGSADNTAAKLSVGTNGQVLMVDPSATYGVKWAAIPPSGGLSTSTEGAIMTMAIGA